MNSFCTVKEKMGRVIIYRLITWQPKHRPKSEPLASSFLDCFGKTIRGSWPPGRLKNHGSLNWKCVAFYFSLLRSPQMLDGLDIHTLFLECRIRCSRWKKITGRGKVFASAPGKTSWPVMLSQNRLAWGVREQELFVTESAKVGIAHPSHVF